MTGFSEAVANDAVLEQIGVIWDAAGVISNIAKVASQMGEIPVLPLWRDLDEHRRWMFVLAMQDWLSPISMVSLLVVTHECGDDD